MKRRSLLLLGLLPLGAVLAAQAPAPAPPAKFKVVIRYQMPTARDQHVAFYDALIEHLQKLNFEFQPLLEKHPETDREDPTKDELVGLVSSANLTKILANPSVATILAVPEGFMLPADPLQPVRVRFELASGLALTRQRELADQVRALAEDLGFREAVGYDARGYTQKPQSRLVGTVPAGNLPLLLKDLRRQPSGWFAPRLVVEELPTPIRLQVPIRIVEVLADSEPLKEPARPPARKPAFLDKLSPELWKLTQDKDLADRFVLVQLILVGTPSADDSGWRFPLHQAAPSLVVEGYLGNTVTAIVKVREIADLAALPQLSVIRMTMPPRLGVDPAIKVPADNARVLEQSGLTLLHKKGFRGQGVRLAIVDTDFRGWEKMVREKRLPGRTRLVDLTAAYHPDVRPAPYAGDVEPIGHGTHCALAAALAAPEVELTLVRIDAVDPYQLHEMLALIKSARLSELILRRADELRTARADLLVQRGLLLQERKALLEDFSDESEQLEQFGFLGPAYGWIFSTRYWHYQRMDYQEFLEKEQRLREDRYWQLVQDAGSLKGIAVVASALTWNDGYALGGASPISRWLNHHPEDVPLWFQSAGNTRGQSWEDIFRDEDGNGVMEFAAAAAPLKNERWTHEINFLAWQPFGGNLTPELPAKARLRVSIQWREPHDPDYFLRPGEEDLYLQPLRPLRLVLLKQRDPQGRTLPGDSMDVVARSYGLAQRLEHQPTFSVYEQVVEYVTETPGRFALRVERPVASLWVLGADPGQGRPMLMQLKDLVPTGIRPLGVAALPLLEKTWEQRPRLLVTTVDEASAGQGRPVFLDYVTDQGSIGVPADARSLITVSALKLTMKPQPYAAPGPPAFTAMAGKPNLWACDGLDVGASGGAFGSSVANAFASGWAACWISSGASAADLGRALRMQHGYTLRAWQR